jgi:tetratricopeptide (TPR) repeat protein
MFCGQCGTRNSRNNKFCRECGTRLETPAPVQSLPEEAFDVLKPDPPHAEEDARTREWVEEAFRAYADDRLDEAQSLCQQALALNPRNTSAHSLLALLYEKQGDVPRAIREYEIVLEINPDSPADRASLARLRGEAEPKGGPEVVPIRNPQSAIRNPQFLAVPVLAGACALLFILLVGSLIAWGRTRRANEAAGTPVARLLTQGQAYYAQQRYVEAADCFRQVLALDPGNAEARRRAAAAERELSASAVRITQTQPLPLPAPSALDTSAQSGEPRPGSTVPGASLAPPRSGERAGGEAAANASPQSPRPPATTPGFNGGRATSARRSPVPPGQIPAPIIGTDRAARPAPAEASPQVAQASISFPPTQVMRPQPTPQPQVTPAPLPRQPQEQPAAGKDSYIRISVKEGPPGPRPPRHTEPATRPEPAPRPKPATTPTAPPKAAQRDLRAEAAEHETRAMRLSAQGDYQAAIQAYQQALDTTPDSPRAGQ